MVGSGLNSNAIAHLLPLATHCDVDGALLVQPTEEGFYGGFSWNTRDVAEKARTLG